LIKFTKKLLKKLQMPKKILEDEGIIFSLALRFEKLCCKALKTCVAIR